ncbi:hypothetical protein ScPMuIL_007211 [Solemya velum]
MPLTKKRRKHHSKPGPLADKSWNPGGPRPGGTGAPARGGRRLAEGLFPPGCQWLVFGVTLVFRVLYVSNSRNWWTLHPDEIFQSIEVAHSELYGYGFRPYEYLRAPGAGSRLPVSEAQTYSLGMYSMRSFLYPQIFVMVQRLVAAVWSDAKLFVVCKVFHAMVTSTLPLAVYGLSLTVHRSRDVAVVGSILTACSLHLNVLGTHTLVNSFLSPGVFYSLNILLQVIRKQTEKSGNVNYDNSDTPTQRVETTTAEPTIHFKENSSEKIGKIFSNGTKGQTEIGYDYRLEESLKNQLRSQLSVAIQFQILEKQIATNWTYRGDNDSSDLNQCLDFVSSQEDVTGLFMDRSVHTSGGYSVIHKDVPIVTLIHNEFYEF